jgi:hypothetical protein
VFILPFKESAVGMASFLQKIARHYRQIRIFRTGAQKNISNKGALLGNISIGGDNVESRQSSQARNQLKRCELLILI